MKSDLESSSTGLGSNSFRRVSVLTISARVVRGIASSLVLLALSAPVLIGQTDCGLALANATTSLPATKRA